MNTNALWLLPSFMKVHSGTMNGSNYKNADTLFTRLHLLLVLNIKDIFQISLNLNLLHVASDKISNNMFL